MKNSSKTTPNHQTTKKSALHKMCLAAGTGALGVAALGTVISSCASDETKSSYQFTDKNIRAIRTFTIQSYTKKLNDAGLTTSQVRERVAKVTEDIDYIINQGQIGGFDVGITYAGVWNYAKTVDVEVFDWVMFDDYMEKQLVTLKTNIDKSALNQEKKDELFNNYKAKIDAKAQDVKKECDSADEAVKIFKQFSQEIAEDEFQNRKQELAEYYLEDFVNSMSFGTQYLYWDKQDFSNKSDGDTLDNIYFTYIPTSELNQNDSFIFTEISEQAIDKHYELLDDTENPHYKLSVLFEKWDSDSKKLTLRLKIEDCNDASVSAISKNVIVLDIPESREHKIASLIDMLSSHTFTLNATMLDLSEIFQQVRENYTASEIASMVASGQPLFTDDDLSNVSSLVYVDGIPFAQNENFNNSNDLKFTFNLLNFNENSNHVTYNIKASLKNDLNTRQIEEETEYEDSAEDVTTTSEVVLKTVEGSQELNVASEQTINEIKTAAESISQIAKMNSSENEKRINNLYIINVTLVVEQAVMAGIMAALAGVYFVAAFFTGGATAPSAIMATIGAAACVAGSVMAAKAAVQYKKQLEEIKEMRANPNFLKFLEFQKDFEKTQQFQLIKQGTFGTLIAFSTFREILAIFQQMTAVYETAVSIVRSAANVVSATASMLNATKDANFAARLGEVFTQQSGKVTQRVLSSVMVGSAGSSGADSVVNKVSTLVQNVLDPIWQNGDEMAGGLIQMVDRLAWKADVDKMEFLRRAWALRSRTYKMLGISEIPSEITDVSEARSIIANFWENSTNLGESWVRSFSKSWATRSAAQNDLLGPVLSFVRENMAQDAVTELSDMLAKISKVTNQLLLKDMSEGVVAMGRAAKVSTPSAIAYDEAGNVIKAANGKAIRFTGIQLQFKPEQQKDLYEGLKAIAKSIHSDRGAVMVDDAMSIGQTSPFSVDSRDILGVGRDRWKQMFYDCDIIDAKLGSAATLTPQQLDDAAHDAAALMMGRMRQAAMDAKLPDGSFLLSNFNAADGQAPFRGIIRNLEILDAAGTPTGGVIPAQRVFEAQTVSGNAGKAKITEIIENIDDAVRASAVPRTASVLNATKGLEGISKPKLPNFFKGYEFVNKQGVATKMRGINAFKAWMIEQNISYASLSGLQKAAIYACPAIEAVAGLVDVVVVITLTILQEIFSK